MQAARANADQFVPHTDFGPIDNFTVVHNTDGKTGQVIFIVLVKPGHFGGLPTQQCTLRLLTTFGNAFDNIRSALIVETSHRKIVEKEKWFGTLNDDIVHAHGHQIDANRIMFVQHKCDLKLGSNPVGRTDQYRSIQVCKIERKKTSKSTNIADNTGAISLFGNLTDGIHQFIGLLNINAGVGICKGLLHIDLLNFETRVSA